MTDDKKDGVRIGKNDSFLQCVPFEEVRRVLNENAPSVDDLSKIISYYPDNAAAAAYVVTAYSKKEMVDKLSSNLVLSGYRPSVHGLLGDMSQGRPTRTASIKDDLYMRWILFESHTFSSKLYWNNRTIGFGEEILCFSRAKCNLKHAMDMARLYTNVVVNLMAKIAKVNENMPDLKYGHFKPWAPIPLSDSYGDWIDWLHGVESPLDELVVDSAYFKMMKDGLFELIRSVYTLMFKINIVNTPQTVELWATCTNPFDSELVAIQKATLRVFNDAKRCLADGYMDEQLAAENAEAWANEAIADSLKTALHNWIITHSYHAMRVDRDKLTT